jgi:transcription antitermination factor NusG
MSIAGYLPLYTTLRQWSDRKKKVILPLFSCYVFVNIKSKDYYRVLNIPGVIRYITFEGKAVTIPEQQIRTVMKLLEYRIEVEEFPDVFHKGANVEIISGPLSGVCGELIEFAGKKRVVIRFESIRKSIVIFVSQHSLKLID